VTDLEVSIETLRRAAETATAHTQRVSTAQSRLDEVIAQVTAAFVGSSAEGHAVRDTLVTSLGHRRTELAEIHGAMANIGTGLSAVADLQESTEDDNVDRLRR
jgi:hypothetical protein